MIADIELKRWADLLRRQSAQTEIVTFPNISSHRGQLIDCVQTVWRFRTQKLRASTAEIFDPTWPFRAAAAQGSQIAANIWHAYVASVTGNSDADLWLTRAIEALDPTALVAGVFDNPEPWWQNEMVILHALHSFALLRRDPPLLARTLRCAQFHLEEIQPDHATNEPWAIHAYASHPDGKITAETLLHAGLMQNGGSLSPAAQLIAQDAAFALEAYHGS